MLEPRLVLRMKERPVLNPERCPHPVNFPLVRRKGLRDFLFLEGTTNLVPPQKGFKRPG